VKLKKGSTKRKKADETISSEAVPVPKKKKKKNRNKIYQVRNYT